MTVTRRTLLRVAAPAAAGLAISAKAWAQTTTVRAPLKELTGTLPAQKRAGIGRLDEPLPEERFSLFTGPVLSEHFALGNGEVQPAGSNPKTHPPRALMDALPQGKPALGTYQVVIPHNVEPSTTFLYNPDGTLASKATLRATGCEATLRIVDSTGQFATITARRLGGYDNLGSSRYSPVVLEIKQGEKKQDGKKQGGEKRSSVQIEFDAINGALVPKNFGFSTGNGQKATIRFVDEAVAHVQLTGLGGIIDERTLVHLVTLAFLLGPLLVAPPENVIQANNRRGCV